MLLGLATGVVQHSSHISRRYILGKFTVDNLGNANKAKEKKVLIASLLVLTVGLYLFTNLVHFHTFEWLTSPCKQLLESRSLKMFSIFTF